MKVINIARYISVLNTLSCNKKHSSLLINDPSLGIGCNNYCHYSCIHFCTFIIIILILLHFSAIFLASCKWRDAQRAMRNRQFIGYTLGHLERNVIKGTTIWFWRGGGGGCQILFGQIIYFRHGLGREIYFHVAWARENLFSCKHGKTTVQLLSRNRNVIESNSIRWNY